MKSLKLFIGLLFIYSCAPTITVNPDIKPSASVTPIPQGPSVVPSVTSSLSSATASPTSDTSIPTPTPTPTLISTAFQEINKIKVISDSGQIMVEGNFNNGNFEPNQAEYEYTSLFNEKAKFVAEIVYKDGTTNKYDLLWDISDPNVASVDQAGFVTAKDKKGIAILSVFLKDDPSKVLKFNMRVAKSLTETETMNFGSNCSQTVTFTRERYKKYPFNYAFINDCFGNNYDISTLATFNGRVYDLDGVTIDGATVNAKSIDVGVSWDGEPQSTVGGAYVFRNAPAGARLEITVTKDGWTTRKKFAVLATNLSADTTGNIYNFGGSIPGDLTYAIQDEPEIVLLKINGRDVKAAAKGDDLQNNGLALKPIKPTSNQLSEETNGLITNSEVGYLPDLTGISSDRLEIEMTFSEPVNKEDVENNFRVTSQSVFSSTPDNKKPIINGVSNSNFPNGESFIIDKNFSGSTFTWSENDNKVIFKTNKAILANTSGKEVRYLVDFDQTGFRDKSSKTARSTKQFRFSPSQVNDYTVFSVSNK